MPDLGSYVSVSSHVLAQTAILVQFGPGQDFLSEIKSYFTKDLGQFPIQSAQILTACG